MCATWPGAIAGFISMTTGPLVVSRVSVFALRSLMVSSLLIGRRRSGLISASLAEQRSVTILSGLSTAPLLASLPALILSTTSMPETTSPKTVYLPVEERRVGEADEELRIGRIRVARARHAERAALERRRGEFGLQIGQIRTARAGAGGIAGLGHEAGNDAMEDDAVVELALHQRLDLRDVLGRQIGPEADDDLAVLGGEDQRVLGVVRRPGRRRRRRRAETRERARRLNNGMRTS